MCLFERIQCLARITKGLIIAPQEGFRGANLSLAVKITLHKHMYTQTVLNQVGNKRSMKIHVW